jgi:multidrug efflux pump subunit AcrB
MMKHYDIVWLLVAIFVVCGIFGLIHMNKQEFPEFTIRQGVVAAVMPGATPEEIEQQVTEPLEDYLFTFQEVDKNNTYSYSRNGIVYVFVELNKSVHNKNETWSKIRHGLKDFKMNLPSGVLALVVNDDFGNTSSLLITMQSKDKNYRELEQYMNQLSDKLRTVKAVGNIKVFGKQQEQISVYIEQEKLATYGISSKTLMLNLYSQGFMSMGGNIENTHLSVPVHINTPFTSEKEVAEMIVYSDPDGNVIRLKDIARIKREYADPASYINRNTEDALVLSVEMQNGNNIVQFGKDVETILEEFQATLPESVSLYRITDLPKVVDHSVNSFLKDLIFSVLVVIVVMLMLFPVRSALVAASGIPIAIAVTWAFMFALGMEINTVTLAALIVVLGMIVDNSIVVIDGYIDDIGHGYSHWHAAIRSAIDYFKPLLIATLAMSAAFFPFMFTLTGPMQDFVKHFPWTFGFALIVSLVIAMFVTPFLEYRFVRNSKPKQKQSVITKAQNRFFKVLQSSYEWLLVRCFRHPRVTILSGVIVLLLSVLLFSVTPVQMMPVAERDVFAVEIHVQPGSSLDQTSAISDSLQRILKNDPRVESVTAFVGTSSPRFMATYAPNLPSENYAQFVVNTTSNTATEELLEEYSERYANYFPQAYVRFKQMNYQVAKNPIEVRLTGDDPQQLREQADKLVTFMHTMDGELKWIHTDWDGTAPMVNIDLDQVESARLGITKSMLALNLASDFNGTPLTTLWEGNYPVSVVLKRERKNNTTDFSTLENEIVPTLIPGTWVPLRQVAHISPGWEPVQIVRRNGVHCITVACDLPYGGSEPRSMAKVKKYIEDELKPSLPNGITVSYGGLAGTNNELIPEIIAGLAIACMIIFLFLLYTFKKISLSFLALAASVFSLPGAIAGIAIFGIDFGITSVLGVVSLIGIIVRNAIIMFEYAEKLRTEEGYGARQAGFEAGKRRMRPIFLTSAAAAVGVIPMILGKSNLWMPMGIVICFGMIVSLLLVVTILPVVYWQVYNKKKTAKS